MKKTLIIVLAVIGLLATTLMAAPAKKMIQVKGSDTLVNLVQVLAEEYMGKNPGTAIAVLGGGSGTGITGLINQTCDIADHSREWNKKEIDQAWEKGVVPRFFVIAVDGLSIVVNEKSSLDRLTMAQVGSLYKGEIKNWKVLGGPDKAVSLYGRQSNSGTYTFLQEHVLGNKNYSQDVKEMNGNAQIIESVIQDEGGIGYVGVGYLFDSNGKIRKGIKVLNISKDASGEAFSPLEKVNIDTGKYPISRPLYQAVNGKPSPAVAAFLRFETGPDGQAIVEREGFFAIGEAHKAKNAKNME
jgi:phosphate transport system substrate-binding protein